MSASKSSPPTKSRYIVAHDMFIFDTKLQISYKFGPGAPEPRSEYTLQDAWAVCDWLNARENPVRADHRDVVVTRAPVVNAAFIKS